MTTHHETLIARMRRLLADGQRRDQLAIPVDVNDLSLLIALAATREGSAVGPSVRGDGEREADPSVVFYCDRCDGCGWYEGGTTLRTTCEVCEGTGVVTTVTR